MRFSNLLPLALVGVTPALACLKINAQGSVGLGGNMILTAVDNGVTTCTVNYSGDADSGTGKCVPNFSLTWNWPAINGPITVHYCNPKNCYTVSVAQDCTNDGNICCGVDNRL
ncbi:MAG: hypothetical protein LQ340_005494 [Diploschistes diacapsis]|nr:MAG: hypothetical protein LQ340_005494 [Diploschistes diacapsis]